jgi:hypothetical protein
MMSLDYHSIISIRNTLADANKRIREQREELQWDDKTRTEVEILRAVSQLLWVVDCNLTMLSTTLDKE